jgi:putative membrane protein
VKCASLTSGTLILFAAACLVTFGGDAFTIHMVAHMATVAIAAPMIAFGFRRTALDVSARLTWITPLTASLIELVTVIFWHLPQVRLIADQSLAATMLEQFSFIAAGLLLWLSCLSAPPLAGAAGLLFTSTHMTLIGVLFALAPRPIFAAGQTTCFGLPLSAATDQQIGGVAMLLVGAVSYLIGGIAVLHRLVSAGWDAPERTS